MPKTQAQKIRNSAIPSTSSSPKIERPTSRASLHFVKSSLQKIHHSSSSTSSIVADLHQALEHASNLNAKHQEQIQVLTTERDAAEDALHDNKCHSRSLEEDFSHADKELEETHAQLHEVRLKNSALQAQLKAKDKQINEMQQQASNQEAELAHVKDENIDLENWVADIKARVKEASAHHTKLETRLQTQNGHILQLKSGTALLEERLLSSNANAEMNRKALLRSNNELKRQNENLQGALKEEKEKTKQEKPAVDWKAQCMRTHLQKSKQIEKLEAELGHMRLSKQELLEDLEGEIRELQTRNLEQWGEFAAVIAEECASVGSDDASSVTTVRRVAVENCFSVVVVLSDVAPSGALGPDTETVDMHQQKRIHRGYRSAVEGMAGPAVFLGCLSAALFLRG